jgi:hypothetical protein
VLAVRQGSQAFEQLTLLLGRLLTSQLEAARRGTWLERLDVAHERGNEHCRALAEARPRDVDLAGATHAVFVEPRSDRIACFATACQLAQAVCEARVEEGVVLDALEERHHLGVGADDVRDVE